MIIIYNNTTEVLPLIAFGKKNDDSVDKGTNRDTPGQSEGARPPRKEEYKDSEGKEKEESSEKKDASESD